MKRDLLDEIRRIYEITYKDKIVSEQIDSLLDKTKDFIGKKIDVPGKADLVNPNVEDLYKTLETAISSGGLTQQKYGSMTYQKEVEAMQIALILTGYKLPRFGVDGLFGPETAAAVEKFKQDRHMMNEGNVTNPVTNPVISASPEVLTTLLSTLKAKNVSPIQIAPYVDPVDNTTGSKDFSVIDLRTNEGFQKYAEICDRFISSYDNPLQITGNMLATGAVKAFRTYGRYVPPELALSQLLLEGGINSDINSRPVRTRNPYNVGNVDSGRNRKFGSVQHGIDAYFKLIASNYIGKGRTVKDLLSNFVNKRGQRYASDQNYENKLASIIQKVDNIAKGLET